MIPLKTLGRWLRPGLLLSLLVMLTGCDAVAILSPKGQIGQDEKTLLITATVLMLLVVIPVIIMTLTFAWKYRASNTKARYEPKWSHSTAIEVVVWSIPCMIVLVLAVLTWRSSRTGSIPSAGFGRQAGHHRGDLAGLEVAVHLSGREGGGRQRNQVPGQHAAELQDHVRFGDECVLHPAPGQHDLLDGCDGDQAPPDRQRDR